MALSYISHPAENMSVASASTVHRDRGGHHIVGGRPSPQQPPVTTTTTTTKGTSVSYAQQQLGVSLSEGLKKAYDGCKAKVERIALQCRAKNRKFRYVPLPTSTSIPFHSSTCRDIEFDLENDSNRCLHNLTQPNIFLTSDVRRIPDIFKHHHDNGTLQFYSGTTKSAEIVQGAVEDCYLVSALSSMTSIEKLVRNLCVAVSFFFFFVFFD